MKNSIFVFAVSAIVGLFASCGAKGNPADTHLAVENGKTVVERYGMLCVEGTQLCDQNKNPVQLRGMSSHGLQWYGKFANRKVIKWLRDDWNCQMWRAAMYLSDGGYIGNPALKNKVYESVEAAIENGMYVIVDWHVLGDHDPLLYQDKAVEFFEGIGKKYPACPNIIYEICNEPNTDGVTWDENIKPYAEKVIPVIRKYSPDNIIVVGTPRWSSDFRGVIKNPITGQKNIMYTYHFYAGSVGKEGRRDVAKALKKGIPVFVTEWGTTQASGDGGVFEKSSMEWIKFLENNGISWANWSVCNKGEDSGVLKFNADRNAEGGWAEKDLMPTGIFLRKVLRNEYQRSK